MGGGDPSINKDTFLNCMPDIWLFPGYCLASLFHFFTDLMIYPRIGTANNRKKMIPAVKDIIFE
jgi:hypothetical protein